MTYSFSDFWLDFIVQHNWKPMSGLLHFSFHLFFYPPSSQNRNASLEQKRWLQTSVTVAKSHFTKAKHSKLFALLKHFHNWYQILRVARVRKKQQKYPFRKVWIEISVLKWAGWQGTWVLCIKTCILILSPSQLAWTISTEKHILYLKENMNNKASLEKNKFRNTY